MQGRVALVTGSTTGMGRAIIEGLARSGCNVVLHGIASAEKMQVRLQCKGVALWIKRAYLREFYRLRVVLCD